MGADKPKPAAVASIAIADHAGPTLSSVAMVALPAAAVVLALNFAIRGVALQRFGIPAPALPLTPLVLASLGATLGPAFGCYMAFRRRDADSLKKFLLPGAVLTLMGIGLEVARFAGGHGDVGGLVVGVSQGLVAIAVAFPLLLWRASSSRR